MERLSPVTPYVATYMPSSRDLRADFFRGVALLTIFANHFNISAQNTEWLVFKLTPSNFTYFSGAEVFVLISGYVFGIVYKKLYAETKWRGSVRKALWRAWDLYVANVMTLFITMAISALFLTNGLVDRASLFPNVVAFFDAPQTFIPAILGMQANLRYFEILNLYILLLLLVPPFLGMVRRTPWLFGGLSLGIYALALNGTLNGIGGGFNVFQWQLFFAGGLLMGWYQPTVPRIRMLSGVALGFLAVGALDVFVVPRLLNFGWLAPDSMLAFALPLQEKGGVLATLQLIGALYLVHCYVPRNGALYDQWYVRPLLVTGQHSLPVFCAGILMTYVAVLLTNSVVSTPLLTLGLLGIGLALSVGMAYLLDESGQSAHRSPTKLESSPMSHQQSRSQPVVKNLRYFPRLDLRPRQK